ncbi:flippase-like domain-containing protein, partial [bacterium]|nr:flippase-like domain-containing protein [bacterium]
MSALKASVKKSFGIFLRYGLAIGILYFLFSHKSLDLSELQRLFDPFILVTLILLKLVIYTLVSLRWRRILQEMSITIPISEALHFGFLNIFFVYVLPGQLSSDVVKGAVLTKRTGSRGAPFGSIVIDRVVGLLSMLIVLVVALVWFFFSDPMRFERILAIFQGVSWVSYFAAITVFTALAIGGIYFVTKSKRFLEVRKIVLKFLSIRFWLDLFMLSLVSNLLVALFLFIVARHLQLDGIDFLACVIVFPLSALAMVVPLTPGSIGVGQFLYGYLFDVYAGHATKAEFL